MNTNLRLSSYETEVQVILDLTISSDYTYIASRSNSPSEQEGTRKNVVSSQPGQPAKKEKKKPKKLEGAWSAFTVVAEVARSEYKLRAGTGAPPETRRDSGDGRRRLVAHLLIIGKIGKIYNFTKWLNN